jgi:arylsulfatase A-like enzyme
MRPALLSLCLAAVMLAAKIATVVLRLLDGGGRGLVHPWAPLVLIADDLLAVIVFATLVTVTAWACRARPRAARWLGRSWWSVYGILAIYVALNVPVARVFSTPTTYAFLHGAGSALGDSFAVYLTPANLGVPAGLILLAALLPRGLARIHLSPKGKTTLLGVSGLTLVIAPWASSSVTTLGLHRNALATLIATTLAQQDADHRAAAPASGNPPALPPAGDADDLTALLGSAAGRNVVWIVLESTAARHLALYGGARDTMPALSALAASAVVFEHAYAAYPESIKGLFSFLCARRPSAHTPTDRYAAARRPCDSIAQRLAAAGYRTGLFHSGRFGYLGMNDIVRARGFDELDDAASIGGPFASSFGVDDPSTVRKLLSFVDAGRERPFFAMYMPIAGHHPYHAPGQGPRPFLEQSQTDRYHNDLFTSDAAFGLLRDGLRVRGLDQRTLYVVVGDHGEAFYEHEGNFAHTLFLYEENLRVPLMFAAPGLFDQTRRARQLASAVDVAPTLLGLLGLPVPASYQGRSLLEARPAVVSFFTDQGLWQIGLRDGPWKFIHDVEGDRSQLFDLTLDPAERRNLAALFPARAARYRAYLKAL